MTSVIEAGSSLTLISGFSLIWFPPSATLIPLDQMQSKGSGTGLSSPVAKHAAPLPQGCACKAPSQRVQPHKSGVNFVVKLRHNRFMILLK